MWEGKQEDGVVKLSVISTLCPIYWEYIRNDQVRLELGKRGRAAFISITNKQILHRSFPQVHVTRFRMTRFCPLRGSVAGRHSTPVLVANYLCRPATLPCVLVSLVIPNRRAWDMGRQKAVRDLQIRFEM
jgi:hypothetical protein